jgi:Ca2+-binding EF-hand superfamily protein
VSEAERKFYEYDTDHSGAIDRNELKPLLRVFFGNRMSDNLMERFASGQLQSADTNKSGQIDFREFLELYAKLKQMLGS